MAVKLRLARRGNRHRPYYHIVATDARNPRDGKFLEQIGRYNPLGDTELIVDKEAALRRLQQGAQPTATVKRLLKRAGVFNQTEAS